MQTTAAISKHTSYIYYYYVWLCLCVCLSVRLCIGVKNKNGSRMCTLSDELSPVSCEFNGHWSNYDVSVISAR